MHILAYGHHPDANSGMSTVLRELMGRISSRGYRITWVAINGHDRTWRDCNVITPPSNYNVSPIEVLDKNIQYKNPDALFTNLNWQGLTRISDITNQYSNKTGNSLPILLHTTFESETGPPEFEKQMVDSHCNPVHYIPYTEPHYKLFSEKSWCNGYISHGIDEVFHQDFKRERFDSSIFNGYSNDTKVVSIVARNERRKNLDQWLKTAGKIKRRYSGNVIFLMNTSPDNRRADKMYSGWNLTRCAKEEGLKPGEDVIWTKDHPKQNAPKERIANIYHNTDVYLSLSGGEGFGLPVAEAMSCETACVLTDHVNHQWVAQDAAKYVPSKIETRLSSGDLIKIPDPNSAAERVVDLLLDTAERVNMAQKGAERSNRFRWKSSSQKLVDYLKSTI